MKLKLLRRLTLSQSSAPGRPLFLAAASGLVQIGGWLYVVADDELHLGVFPASGPSPGQLLRLFPGRLPEKTKARKRKKPDLEALVILPSAGDGTILAVPSGSKKKRYRGAVVRLVGAGALVEEVSFRGLYRHLETKLPGTLNIEGAVVRAEELLLFQRGNSKGGKNAIITLKLEQVLSDLRRHGEIRAEALTSIKSYDLGAIGGVRLTFTDAAALPDGRLLFTAAAEATDDAVEDGEVLGSIVGIIDRKGKLGKKHRLDPTIKAEGVSVRVERGGVTVFLVTDADDSTVPAALYKGRIPLK